MHKAIITGITGQDGAYLAKYLLEKGYSVVGITRDKLDMNNTNLRYLDIINDVQIVELPSLDKDRIFKILNKFRPNEIYNLSSQSSVGLSFEDPYTTLNYNILSVLYWLEGIKSIDIGIKFYQASSSEMFGNINSDELPIKESNIFNPASPYGISKASAHWLTVNYRESSKLFSACGILFNHESALRGGRFVIKKVINTAVKIAMGLHKDPLHLGNLNIQRDWGYAPEYVKAMWLILQQEKASDFLICSGNSMSLKTVVEFVFKYLNISIEKYLIQDDSLLRLRDLDVIYGDNSKAKSLLNWNYDMTNENLLMRLIEDEYIFIKWQNSSTTYGI